VGEAEALDPVVVVVVAAMLVGHRVRAPLQHAERRVGAGEGIAGAAAMAEVRTTRFGTDERIDVLSRIVDDDLDARAADLGRGRHKGARQRGAGGEKGREYS
jgi:hypothetical protein